MAIGIVNDLDRDVSIPASRWNGVLLDAVELYMTITSSTREDFIKELGELSEQALAHRFEDIIRIEVSDS